MIVKHMLTKNRFCEIFFFESEITNDRERSFRAEHQQLVFVY